MKIISSNEFKALCNRQDAKLLKTTYNRPKLLETSNGKMVKIFYPRNKKFSGVFKSPQAIRFSENSKKLQAKGITVPEVESIQYCKANNTHILTYDKMSGTDTRVLAYKDASIIEKIAYYIAKLHEQGVFFRSIHLENILYHNGSFALLDIVDVNIKNKPLSLYMRVRNIKHMIKTKDDKEFWIKYGIDKFFGSYLKYSNLNFYAKYVVNISQKVLF